jgi:hypothetical protein
MANSPGGGLNIKVSRTSLDASKEFIPAFSLNDQAIFAQLEKEKGKDELLEKA